MSRQQCPSCGKHWDPPGPCSNLDGGEPCGFLEPPRTVRSVVPTPARAPIPQDNTLTRWEVHDEDRLICVVDTADGPEVECYHYDLHDARQPLR